MPKRIGLELGRPDLEVAKWNTGTPKLAVEEGVTLPFAHAPFDKV
jgi:hypothetical protein